MGNVPVLQELDIHSSAPLTVNFEGDFPRLYRAAVSCADACGFDIMRPVRDIVSRSPNLISLHVIDNEIDGESVAKLLWSESSSLEFFVVNYETLTRNPELQQDDELSDSE